MTKIRLQWEPEGRMPLEEAAQQVQKYMDGDATFALFPAGTCLMLKPMNDLDKVINGAMNEARRLADFKVYRMHDSDYLVFFAKALLVYVGESEFEQLRDEILTRLDDLKFSGEELKAAGALNAPDDMLVGLYARGKLQGDAWGARNYRIIRPSEQNSL